MKIRIRKITTNNSNNEWWVLFEQGHIDKPICLLDEFETKQLLKDVINETEKEK